MLAVFGKNVYVKTSRIKYFSIFEEALLFRNDE